MIPVLCWLFTAGPDLEPFQGELLALPGDTLPPLVSDTLLLEEIQVQSTRIREPIRYQPVSIQYIDSLRLSSYRTQSISAILSRYSSLFIRDNGPGGLATLSQRGLSPSQTQVLWEGFPINSLSLGLTDLSVIPGGLFNAVEVSPGTPSSAFGGGSLGGTVFLSSSETGPSNHLEATQSAGAFGMRSTQLRLGHSSGDWSFSLRGFYHTAENDFPYFNRATQQEEHRSHNAGRSGHLTGTASYRLSQGKAYTTLWVFDRHEEIPGSVLAGNTEAVQTDRGLRWVGGVDLMSGGWNMTLGSFLDQNRFTYEDPPVQIDSRFDMTRWLNDLSFEKPSTGRIVWQGGLSGGLERVATNNFAFDPRRLLLGAHLSPVIRLQGPRIRISPSVRGDHYSGIGTALSPSLGWNWEGIENRLHLKGMVSRDFNPPSFNDLYWVPGGNPDLNPEQSFKTEIGTLLLLRRYTIESFKFTAYRIWLEDGIFWFPDNEGIWSPSNVEEVDAYGVESEVSFRRQINPVDLQWNLGLDWRRSVIAAPRFTGDQAVGNQMRYVPEWTFRGDFSIRMADILLHANYRRTGQRFTTEDHTSSLDTHQIFDLSISAEQEWRSALWHARLSIGNLLDEQYEVIRWFPMPGRHFEFSIGIRLPG